jgi:glutathione synthase/RimK-type ligase-like ATP-grasp enzyme
MRDTILFATSAEFSGLTDDDRSAADALRGRGFRVRPLVWSDRAAVGDATVVVRSAWDYHLRPDEFLAWIDALAAAGARLVNPAPTLRWNLHKRYLLELAADGVAIPPTELVPRGATTTLRTIAARLDADRLVVKPAISLSASGTWRTHITDDAEPRFAAQREGADLLVQRYVPDVTDGELSLVYFAGRYSHCVRKLPAPGDFRVQAEFGGTRQPWRPDAAALATADRIVARHAADAVYCRVDGIVTAAGFVLMELELIDPVLFFAHDPAAVDRFAAALAARIAAG